MLKTSWVCMNFFDQLASYVCLFFFQSFFHIYRVLRDSRPVCSLYIYIAIALASALAIQSLARTHEIKLTTLYLNEERVDKVVYNYIVTITD